MDSQGLKMHLRPKEQSRLTSIPGILVLHIKKINLSEIYPPERKTMIPDLMCDIASLEARSQC